MRRAAQDVDHCRPPSFGFIDMKNKYPISECALVMGKTIKIPAIHPHWTGVLTLSPDDSRVRLEPFGSVGRYERNNQEIKIIWDRFPEEIFVVLGGICVQKNHINSIAEIKEFHHFRIGSNIMGVAEVALICNKSQSKIYMRPGGSDPLTYNQIFVSGEYNFECLPERADIIVDVGANIGLSALYFSKKYKNAKIIAVEPEVENFRLLSMNAEFQIPSIVLERAAIWGRDGSVDLRTHDENGKSLDSWGVQVAGARMSQLPQVPSFTLDTLFRKHGLDRVDILKIDVEGAELEIFSATSQDWKTIVDYIIIETHDRFRSGCEAAVRSALEKSFVQIAGKAELQVFARRDVMSRA